MKKALIFMANGFEEIEAITLVDLLRRANIQVDMCSITGSLEVTGSHNIQIKTNLLLEDVNNVLEYDALITPGGMPGSTYLKENSTVISMIQAFYGKEYKFIASICASPIVLKAADISYKIEGTCYPGFEEEVSFKQHKQQAVVQDQNVLTSMGPGTAFALGLKLIECLVGKVKAEELYQETMFAYR